MKVSNISKSYGDKPVVKQVSFELPKGKLISFIGPNGAGKSTVLHMIARLIPRDSGTIEVDGLDIGQWKDKELAKRLSILTQHNNVTMKLTVRELVSFGRFPHSGNKLTQEDHLLVEQAIDYMELREFSDRHIDALSGGQRQRAYIAMILAQDTDYIILDEPTNNLDIYHSSQMMKLLRRMCDELGKTIVVVLHDINFASCYSDYIAAFKNGELYRFDTAQALMAPEHLKALYNVEFEIQQTRGKSIAIYY
ncbi:ATP-binding cassette domain-containing protein [Vibrio sp. SM6]|uniref:ATP-binding cassette domain-containing protein n=1 Tax=Vibrio agarilyticus TaxID=2726741 RepID=A0A7X8TQY7_9VIBR|nr:ATP-binding cassette domain-containing protein [Vibrio agarilyticus]